MKVFPNESDNLGTSFFFSMKMTLPSSVETHRGEDSARQSLTGSIVQDEPENLLLLNDDSFVSLHQQSQIEEHKYNFKEAKKENAQNSEDEESDLSFDFPNFF